MSNEERSELKKINVRDWIILSTVMIGAVLTILALIWSDPPISGILSATFLLMLSFIFFVNSVTANSNAQFEANLDNFSERRVKRFVIFAEYSFGFGFTLVISAFAILGYKYILSEEGRRLLALIIPAAFLITAWIIILIYNVISYEGKAFKPLRSLKRNLWILLELICLIIIVIDFFEIIKIP